ncbi:hypothetical protein KCU88_g3943, partial [Aureobasidium melanogenum]
MLPHFSHATARKAGLRIQKSQELTRCAIKVSKAEHISRTADWTVASAADQSGLSVHEHTLAWNGRCHDRTGASSEGDDDG